MDALSPLLQLGEALQAPLEFSIATGVLGVMFIWSGITKVAKPRQAAMAMVHLGVAKRPRAWYGRFAGWAEVTLGVSLAIAPGLPPILLITAATLTFFAVLLSRPVILGQSVSCFCFGESEDKVTALTVLRTVGLAAFACLLLFASPTEAFRAPSEAATYLSLCTAVGIVATVMLVARVRPLLSWNHEIVAHFRARAAACR